METLNRDDVITPERMAEMQARADRAAKGIRDPEDARRAREDMDRVREEIFRKHGILNVAVDLIREGRDEG